MKLKIPAGFRFSGLAAGIKASGKPDVGLAEAPGGASAAALFTRNQVVAAPVQLGRKHLRSARGQLRAVLVNSGNANCATGFQGLAACEQVCRSLAALLHCPPQEVFPSSTGIIGILLPAERIIQVLPDLLAGSRPTSLAAKAFARAILTTDTRLKSASAVVTASGKRVRLLGIAKGAGMVHPQLATMLAYLFTDVAASPGELSRLLQPVCDETFNSLSIDGDTSTNDTVLLLASGASKVRLSRIRGAFRDALLRVCSSLAEQIVSDGEGVRHVIRLHVRGARSQNDARRVARGIALSSLVKTAWAGADPNWGRILSAVGSAGVPVSPERIDIFLGRQQVCKRGRSIMFDHKVAHRYLSRPAYEITVQLGLGRASADFLTCDLTEGYVRLNAEYST